jgi:hypothetical protein
MKKVYVDENGLVTIICPKCEFEKNVDVTDYKDTPKQLKAKCKCGETYRLTLEFRKKYRKNVTLPGEFVFQRKGEKGEIIIRDLSLSGVRFESLKPHQFLTDDALEMTFKIDNHRGSEVRKLIKVVWVEDRVIGARFSNNKPYESDLGFYMKK